MITGAPAPPSVSARSTHRCYEMDRARRKGLRRALSSQRSQGCDMSGPTASPTRRDGRVSPAGRDPARRHVGCMHRGSGEGSRALEPSTGCGIRTLEALTLSRSLVPRALRPSCARPNKHLPHSLATPSAPQYRRPPSGFAPGGGWRASLASIPRQTSYTSRPILSLSVALMPRAGWGQPATWRDPLVSSRCRRPQHLTPTLGSPPPRGWRQRPYG